MSKHKEIHEMVFAAILIALTILLSLPYLFIPTGPKAAFTVAHIPVLVGAILLGKRYGALLGLVMGLSSLVIASFMLGDNAPFTNPLLSVLPRVFFGWIIGVVYEWFTGMMENRRVAVGITLGLSTLIHSIVVLTIFYIVVKTGFYFTASENPMTTNKNILVFIIGLVASNGIFEMVAAVLVGLPIILVMDKVIEKEDLESEDE